MINLHQAYQMKALMETRKINNNALLSTISNTVQTCILHYF